MTSDHALVTRMPFSAHPHVVKGIACLNGPEVERQDYDNDDDGDAELIKICFQVIV